MEEGEGYRSAKVHCKGKVAGEQRLARQRGVDIRVVGRGLDLFDGGKHKEVHGGWW